MTDQIPPGETPSDAILRKARQHYASLSEALQAAERQLKEGDRDEVRRVPGLLRDHWKAFLIALELEMKLEKRCRESEGIGDARAVDLDNAKREIGRRLARLKIAAGDPSVSGQPE